MSPHLGPLSDRIVRARKGNQAVQFSEMSGAEISETIERLVLANGLTDAFFLNAIDHRLTSLCLTWCYHIRKYSLGMIPGQCSSLESLNLSNCRQVDNKLVTNLLAQCLKLRHLVLDGCVKITDAAFLDSANLGRIRALSLAGCRQISEEALLRIAQVCVSVEELNLAGLRSSVTRRVVWAILDSALSTQSLQNLDISDCAVLSSDDTFVQYQLKLDLVPHALLPVARIKLAGLSGLPPKYTHRTVGAIARLCGSNLVELDTTWCAGMNDEACFALASNCPNLRTLNICNSQVTASGIELLASHLVHLQALDLSWCLKVNGQAVTRIQQDMHALVSLNLSHCVDFLSGSSLTADQIRRLVSLKGNSFHQLELAGLAKTATPEVVHAIAANCSSLTHLSLSLGAASSADLSDLAAAFKLLGQEAQELKQLQIDASRVEGRHTEFLLEGLTWPNFPSLQKLALTASPRSPFGDEVLEAILSGGRLGLESLELRNCGDLSPTLFHDWIKGYSPDREAQLVVDAMIDSELQRGYMSSSSKATVVARGSDSEAPTVIFRGKEIVYRKKNRYQPPNLSCSETDTTLVGFDLLRSSIVLSDAARAMDSLKALTLTGAARLTDSSLDRLSLMLTYMQNLAILDAPLLTDESVEPVRRRCRLLRSLEITGPKLRVRIDSSKFFNRRHRRKGQPPAKRKLCNDE